MDDLFLKRVLFEWLRDRSCWVVTESEDQRKNRRIAEIASLKDILRLCGKPIDFSKIDSCSFFTGPCHEFYPPHRQRHL
jgi:hypothetical protein